jgi:hypothetical protein
LFPDGGGNPIGCSAAVMTAWRLGAGWQPHRHLGIEVTGWSLDVVPQVPFDNGMGVFGRAG